MFVVELTLNFVYARALYDRGYKTLKAVLHKSSLLYPKSNHSEGKSHRKGRRPNNWSPRYLVFGLSCFLITTVNGSRTSALRGGYKDPNEQVFPLYDGLSSAPRYLEEDSSEPFTIASLDAEVILDALDTAKAAVTEYVAEELNEVFDPLKDELESLLDFSPDSIKNISRDLTKCFEELNDEDLDRLENITSFISDFSPDAVFEKLLSPDEDQGSCLPSDIDITDLTGLPDISSSADNARQFSLNLYDCIANAINSADLGVLSSLIEVPELNRRELEETYFGITLGADLSVDVVTPKKVSESL